MTEKVEVGEIWELVKGGDRVRVVRVHGQLISYEHIEGDVTGNMTAKWFTKYFTKVEGVTS